MKRYKNNNYWELFFDDGSRILEHRYVMECYINRKLTKQEIVHHINGDGFNNNIYNLELMTLVEHSKMHGLENGRTYITVICAFCGEEVEKYCADVTYKQKQGVNTFFCNKSCKGKYEVNQNPHTARNLRGNVCEHPYEEFKHVILKELNDGLTGYQISKKYNVPKATVYSYIKRIKLNNEIT